MMSEKRDHLENTAERQAGAVASVALLCMALATPALSQVYDEAEAQDAADSEELLQRFEAEHRRQQQQQLENVRLQQQKLRLENERLRQETERREQERLRLENERLRQDNERHKLEQLHLENLARERERVAALEASRSKDRDMVEQLRMLGRLRDDGVLTEEEFQRLKQKILD